MTKGPNASTIDRTSDHPGLATSRGGVTPWRRESPGPVGGRPGIRNWINPPRSGAAWDSVFRGRLTPLINNSADWSIGPRSTRN